MNKIEAVKEALEQWKEIVDYELDSKPENASHNLNNCALCEYVYKCMKNEDPLYEFNYWDKERTELRYPKLNCAKYCPVGKNWVTKDIKSTNEAQYFCEHPTSPYSKFNNCEDNDYAQSCAEEIVDLLQDTLNHLQENTNEIHK